MRYLLTLLLLFGISFGQKTVTIKEHIGEEKKVEVKKEIKDGKVLLSITENGKTEKIIADLDDKEAMAKLDEKLEAYDIGKDAKVYKKVIKHDCEKEDCEKKDCDKKDCEHADKIKIIKKVKEGGHECEHANIEKDNMTWHIKDEDGNIKIIKKHMGEDKFLTDEKAGFLGVQIQDLSDQLSTHFKVKDGNGVLVSEVVADSPAEKAGIKAGDIITKVDDKDIEDASDLTTTIRSYEPESKVSISVIRDGKKKKINTMLGESENNFIYKFGDLGEMDEKHKMLLKMHPEGLEDFKFHSFPFDQNELKEQMDELRKELKEMKKQLKTLQENK